MSIGVICMLLSTICFLFFAFLFLTAGNSIVGALTNCYREVEVENVKKTQWELECLVENMKQTKDTNNKKKIQQGRDYQKKIKESKKRIGDLQGGKVGVIDLIPVAGYRMIQLLGWDSTSPTIKNMYNKCIQFKEKKEAMNYTYYLVGSLIGYVLLGLCVSSAALGLALARGMGTSAIVVGAAFLIVTVMLGYLPYDSVNSIITKRAEEIENEFPQVVSKMALLTVAGMEVNQAWKLTCRSGKGTLYEEMRRVLVELDNNVPPTEAYSKFITRCNNNYTTKLATAIIQNASKGNSEIVQVFRRLNDESWMEHRHNARRKGEQISSKLLVPTILMFVGILILVIVPVVGGFNM